MRKSKGTGSAAASMLASKSKKGGTDPKAAGVASQSKRAIKRRVHADKINRPVQLTIFDYAAAIGVTLLPEAS